MNGLLIGDSFAGQYEPFWKLLAQDLELNISAVTTGWCFPTTSLEFKMSASGEALKQCKINRSFLKDQLDNFDLFVIGAAWGDYYEDDFLSEIERLVEELEGKLLIIMSAPKYLAVDNVKIYNVKRIARGYHGELNSYPSKLDLNMRLSNQELDLLASSDPNIIFISRNALFGGITEASYEWMPSGLPYHNDKRHISLDGSKQVFQNFKNSKSYISLLSFMSRTGSDSEKLIIN